MHKNLNGISDSMPDIPSKSVNYSWILWVNKLLNNKQAVSVS